MGNAKIREKQSSGPNEKANCAKRASNERAASKREGRLFLPVGAHHAQLVTVKRKR